MVKLCSARLWRVYYERLGRGFIDNLIDRARGGREWVEKDMTENLIELESRRLQRLAPRELARALMDLAPGQRLKTILERPDAQQVVAALPEQDFYLCVKEIGQTDALPLLAMASMDQLNLVFDLEWWRKDQVVPARALEWLTLLAEAGEEQVAQWLFQVDFELLVTLFKKWVHLEVLPDDADLTEVREQLPKCTLDDQYFWDPRYPQFEDFIRSILMFLFETHQGFYWQLVTHVLESPASELEEEAYRFHKARQEDHAIADFHEAVEIYRPLSADQLALGKDLTVPAEDAAAAAPGFALALVPRQDLLRRALEGIGAADLADALRLELAALANKIVVADQLPLDDPESLRAAVAKASALINLGLDVQTSGEQALAEIALQDLFLEHLFRFAHGRLARLRQRARRLTRGGWISKWSHSVQILENPWQERLELLQEKTPRMKRGNHEDFIRTRADLFQARKTLNALIALAPLAAALDPAARSREMEQWPLWSEAQVREPDQITLGVLLLTAAARDLTGHGWQPAPLDPATWAADFPLLSPAALITHIRAWVRRVVADPVREAAMEPYLKELLDGYREEILPFVDREPPDPRLIPFFLFATGP